MRLCDLADSAVGLLGFGREGRATLAALQARAPRARVVVLEDAAAPHGVSLPWRSGDDAVAALAMLDVVVASPGVPPRHAVHAAARERGLRVTTATNLFLAECAHEDLPVVAVTGSKGKSTTSTLLHLSLRQASRESVLAGNVGIPALDALDDAVARRATVVLEMSSYQASALDAAPEIAVYTELFPEHLDWHGSVERYFADKLRLAALQDPAALTAWNGSSHELARRAPLGPARHEAYAVPSGVHVRDGAFRRAERVLFPDGEMLLRGAHNRRNACAVLTVAAGLGVPDEAVRETLATFGGLPHRLEDVGEHRGIRWINDSISTAPEAGVAALEAFAGEADTLIAGGQDRGFDYAPLAEAIVARGLPRVGVLPPAGLRLAQALRERAFTGAIAEHGDLASAVEWAARQTPRGRTVIFSPSAPSYGAFRNFEHRGAAFQELVAALGYP
jgi:UDP-N-acetylmuramoyl-L-alanine---L-glutamate ligase